MECPICLKIIQESVVTNCVHHFCKNCLEKWVRKKDNCPKCRSFIYSINNDEEFNLITNNSFKSIDIDFNYPERTYEPIFEMSESDSDEEIKFFNLSISQLPFKKIGITLIGNSYNSVKITKVDYKSVASFVGLKKGDIILSINNIPCISQEQSIKILEFNIHIKCNIKLEILRFKNYNLKRLC